MKPANNRNYPRTRRRHGRRKRRRPAHQTRQPGRQQAHQPYSRPETVDSRVEGVLDVAKGSGGFLRQVANSFQDDPGDAYVHAAVIKRFGLKAGCDVVAMAGRQNGRLEVADVETINELAPETFRARTPFADLTSVDPLERLQIDATNDISLRVLDLISPIGKGQRGLIVASPRTGKTMLLQKLAQSIEAAHPEVHLIVALIDERPEEITEMRRSVSAEVVHSSNDHTPQRHTRIVEILLERVRRLVEAGRDVVILADSLTRIARAYNTNSKGSGRTLSGGLDSTTMQKPREFFGAARKVEEGGSLTIIATALIDTGSRMDDVIFEEFKGTGNMELVLDRDLADRRIWPAINIAKSGTRKEEKLRSPEDQKKVNLLRRALADRNPAEAMQLLLPKLEKTADNRTFLDTIQA